MDIYKVGCQGLAASTNGADLYSIAVNQAIPMEVSGKDGLIVYASVLPEGITTNLFDEAGGTSAPVLNVTPQYYPYATDGAECAAIVKNLTWADNNLETGYEYLLLTPASGSNPAQYFVSGVLNSTKTQFNDPFGSSDVTFAVNWAGNFAVGINPF